MAQGAIQTVLKSFSTIPQEVSAAEERPKGQLFSSVLEEFSRCTTIQVRAEGTKQPLHLAEDTCEHITDSAIKISILNSQDSFFLVSHIHKPQLCPVPVLSSQQWRITPDSHLFLCCFISHVLGDTSSLPVADCRETSQAVNVYEPLLSCGHAVLAECLQLLSQRNPGSPRWGSTLSS